MKLIHVFEAIRKAPAKLVTARKDEGSKEASQSPQKTGGAYCRHHQPQAEKIYGHT